LLRHQLPALICVAFLVPAAASARPLHIAQERQLFVDDYIVEGVENVAFTLHQPEKHPGNPVLLADKPWEAKSVALYGTVLFDDEEKLFKMWYRAIEDTCYACYATSQDGVHWHKPVLNAREYKGSTENNIVLGSVSPKFYLDGFAVIKDIEEDDPGQRYKMLTYNGDRRFAAMVSPDGIHWNGPVNAKKHDTGDVVSMYYDTGLEQYVALLKRRYVFEDGRRVRARLTAFSEDFVRWTAPDFVLVPDEHDPPSTEFYSHVAYMYEGLRIGYLGIFTKSTELIDSQLCSSRDGHTWQRYRRRTPLLPNTPGTFDGGMLLANASGCIVRDGTIWIYYCGYASDHAGRTAGTPEVTNGLGLARLRQDGFVSADAGPEGGVLLTKPFVCPDAPMHVNADAPDGEVRVTLLDAGKPLATSTPLTGDSLDAVVGFSKAGPDIAGRTVRARFQMRNAKLYAFWFAHERGTIRREQAHATAPTAGRN